MGKLMEVSFDTDYYNEDPESYEKRFENSKVEYNSQMWAKSGNHYVACEESVKTLPSAQFLIEKTDTGFVFVKNKVNSDKLLILPDTASSEIIKGIEDFWNKKEHFQKFNFLHKRGILLYGGAGSGKTSTINIISTMMIERNGIVIYVTNPCFTGAGLQVFRKIEPNRNILLIFEDIDTIIEKYGESDILALLDGELQLNNIVCIATTNYIEKIEDRIKNRPSRFDIVKKIGMPNADARRQYLEFANPRLKDNKKELEKWIDKTKGISIAHLKEIIISYEILGLPFDEVLNRLSFMAENNDTSDSDNVRTIGFVHNAVIESD